MAFPQSRRRCGDFLALAALASLWSCGGGGSSPSPPPSSGPPPVPGATQVNGSERMGWSQSGDTLGLRFRAYVDGNPVALDAATCNQVEPSAECSSPLPQMTDGVHTIAVATIAATGLESERSDAITVQKISVRASVSAASFPDAASLATGAGPALVGPDGRTFGVEVVARSLHAPVQVAAAPDGRVIVAEADGRIHVLRPGDVHQEAPALDARVHLQPAPMGPVAVALHPDFARNHFVYVSFLAEDGPGQTRLRLVRLREVGGALGEPATLFESRVAMRQSPGAARAGATTESVLAEHGPRVAFGPDGLLYALLPPGMALDDATASDGHGSMLRLEDDGRRASAGPLSELQAHPLGFGWHPVSGALWGIMPDGSGEAVARALTGVPSRASAWTDSGRVVLRAAGAMGPVPDALVYHEAQLSTWEWARAIVEGIDLNAPATVRLSVPVLADGLLPGVSGRILDVATGGGAVFLSMDEPWAPGDRPGEPTGTVLRITPR